MKKVLIVLPTIGGGGTGKVLLNLVNSLDDTKYEITIKSIYDNFEWAKYYKSSVKYSSFYKSSKNRKLNWLKARIYTFSIKKLPPQILYRLFVKENYDVEIAFFRGASIKILSGSTNKKSKKLAWVHNDFTRCTGIFDWFISEKQTINAYKQFDKIICVSEYAKNKFIERMGIDKDVIVRYNVNLCNEIIEKSTEEFEKIKNGIDFTICTVGHLGEAKGYDRLLEVHKMLIDEQLYHNLVIVGSGTQEEEKLLVDYINEHNLNNTVHLIGQQENPYKYIANADLFVCSSRWEGFSTVISEATILKTPIVTTRVSGVDELFLDNEYGLITENNTESLYEGLKSILIDKDLYNYYKDKIGERSQFFNTELAVKSIEQLF